MSVKDKIKILFYPEPVRTGAKVFDYCESLGFETTNYINAEGITAVFFNHPNPQCIYQPDNDLLELSKKHRVYNINCNNTRKSYVADIHLKVFGYNASVGKKFKGKMVRKSDLQYKRCEVIVSKYSYARHLHYMKFINTYSNGYYSNFRVPYYDGAIPCVVQIKKKDPFDRKSKTKLVIKKPSFWFSPEEIKKIRQFCVAMGLDYGEIDVLRDKNDKRIYIIDVNDKPGMGIMGKSQKVRDIFTEGFKQMILR